MNGCRRLWQVVAVCLVLLLLISACAPAATPTTAPATATTAVQEPTEVPQPETPTEIWIVGSTPEGQAAHDYLLRMIDEFEAENPNIVVKLESPGYELYDQRIRSYIETGNPPDAVTGAISVLRQYAKEGLTAPIDTYLAQQNYEGDAVWKDSFYASLMEQNYVPDGKNGMGYYSVPTQMHIAGIFYNTVIFDELGLQPPATVQEIFVQCEQIKTAGFNCFGIDGGFTPYITIPFAYIASRVGGEQAYYDTALHKDGTSWTDNPAWLTAAQLTQELYNYHQSGFLGSAWPAAQVEFSQGKTAMMYVPSWLPSELMGVAPEGFSMQLIAWPEYEGGPGDQTATQLNFNGYALAAGAKHPQETMEFLKFLSSRHATEVQAAEFLIPSPTIGAALPESLAAVNAILSASKTVPEGMGVDNDAPEWRVTVLEPLLAELALGMDPAEFLEQLQQQSDDYYAGNS